MAFIDYYAVLGVSKTASDREIKNAFRKLARKYHPDLNPNDQTAQKKFQELNEANEVLSDPEKRKKYDRYGENWQHGDKFEQAYQGQQSRPQGFGGGFEGFGGGFGAGRGGAESYSGDNFSDFFRSMFGGGGSSSSRGAQSRYRGQDYTSELRLTLQQIIETHKQTLTVNGKSIRLTIPAGVENGQTIKIAGHGAPGTNGGPAGDLYLKFIIADDAHFTRKGSDLYLNLKLNLYTAVLGGDVTVDTLSGKVKVKVTPGTQNNTKIKLKGKGLPVYKKANVHGDLYVTYDLQVPTNLTDRQRKLFEELSQS